MIDSSDEKIAALLGPDDLALDVGGWAKPWARADWVIDLMPYATRGLYGPAMPDEERFTESTWVARDICARESWPFADDQFDFAVCSHTLEDIRDPIFVCSELIRVAKAGYVEVPSRLLEQTRGVSGPWVGWSHHRWLVDAVPGGLDFVGKPHLLQSRPEAQFPVEFKQVLAEEEQVVSLFWEGEFSYGERIFMEPSELDAYLADFVRENLAGRVLPPPPRGRRFGRLRRRIALRR